MNARFSPLGLGLFVLACVLLPLIPGGYVLYIFSLVLIYTLASFGTNILTGYTNLISLAGAVFFGIGAYGASIHHGSSSGCRWCCPSLPQPHWRCWWG